MKRIPVSNPDKKELYALVDDEDYELLSKRKWKLSQFGYAIRTQRVDGGYDTIRMHRVVNKTPEGMDTDHINGKKLDNQKANLRTCTRSQNFMNKKARSKSGYKGVSYDKRRDKWYAEAGPAGTKRYLGTFDTKEEAALAYNKAAKRLYGDFARLNKITAASSSMEAT